MVLQFASLCRTLPLSDWVEITDEIEIRKESHSVGFDIHFRDGHGRNFGYQLVDRIVLQPTYAIEIHIDTSGEAMYRFYKKIGPR